MFCNTEWNFQFIASLFTWADSYHYNTQEFINKILLKSAVTSKFWVNKVSILYNSLHQSWVSLISAIIWLAPCNAFSTSAASFLCCAMSSDSVRRSSNKDDLYSCPTNSLLKSIFHMINQKMHYCLWHTAKQNTTDDPLI